MPERFALDSFLPPRVLFPLLSHDATKREAYLNQEFARLSQEITHQKFGRYTNFQRMLVPVLMPDGSFLKGVWLSRREYRGTPLSMLTRLAQQHGLDLNATPDLLSAALLPKGGKIS